MTKRLILCMLPLMTCLAACSGNQGEVADRVIYGNIVTMDETNKEATALAIKNGKIFKVGNKDTISKYVGGNTKVETLNNDEYMYPGFTDGHNHSAIYSTLKTGLTIPIISEKTFPGDFEGYAKYVYDNLVTKKPDASVYQGMGFWKLDENPTAKMLDDYCPTTKPVVLVDAGGHTAWLNTPAIKAYVGDTPAKVNEFINTFGTDCVITDGVVSTDYPNGYPTGYFVETPRFAITGKISHTVDEIKGVILDLQDSIIKQGFTTICDCSIVENEYNQQVTAFKELERDGLLKIKYRAYYEINEYYNKEYRDTEIAKAINLNKELTGDKFQIIGLKAFLDGVAEALTSWTNEAYPEEAEKGNNYHGINRWKNESDGSINKELINLIYQANSNGMNVQLHAFGNAANHQALLAFKEVQNKLKNEGKPYQDLRNAIAHTTQIDNSDLDLFVETNTTALVAPHWSPAKLGTLDNEEKSFGVEGAADIYKIKSYIDKGINTAFHTDGMCPGGAAEMIYTALTRVDAMMPELTLYIRGEEYDDNWKVTKTEIIDGETALKCLTLNSSKVAKSDAHSAVIKEGYDADFVIYNVDFRDTQKVSKYDEYSKIVLTGSIVNGEFIYRVSK